MQEDFLRRPERKWFTFKMLGHHTRGGFFVDREEISYKISCACQIPRSICNCREQFPHKNWNTASDCPPSEDETSDPQSFHDQKEDVLVPSSSLSINPCFNFHTRFNFAKWLIYWSKQWIQEKKKKRIPQRILTVLDRCKRSQAFIRLVKCGERNNREWAEKHSKQRNSHQAVQAAVSSTCALSKVGRKLFQRK